MALAVAAVSKAIDTFPLMPFPDNDTLRKAATWQHFKEAQSLLSSADVLSAEETSDGWRGSVRGGKRTLNVIVTKRTATWFDASCPCPSSRRDGAFCPHAIAIALRINTPAEAVPIPAEPSASPQPQKTKTTQSPAAVPSLAWHIQFNGPWRSLLSKSSAAVTLNIAGPETLHTPADATLTQFLLGEKVVSTPPIHLRLNQRTLPQFLRAASSHPRLQTSEGDLIISENYVLSPENILLEKGELHILPPRTGEIVEIGEEFYLLGEDNLNHITSISQSSILTSVIRQLASKETAVVPIASFLQSLESFQSHFDFSGSTWFSSLRIVSVPANVTLHLRGSAELLTLQIEAEFPADIPSLHQQTLSVPCRAPVENPFTPGPLLAASLPFKKTFRTPSEIHSILIKDLPRIPTTWQTSVSPAIQEYIDTYAIVTPTITITDFTPENFQFTLTYPTSDGRTLSAAEVNEILQNGSSGQSTTTRKTIVAESAEDLIHPLLQDLDVFQENGAYRASAAAAIIIQRLAPNSPESALEEVQLPTTVTADLRPYQHQGFSWLVKRMAQFGGALLADDMGLGKTLQTITFIEHSFAQKSLEGPAIVIVTSSLLGNWRSEFSKFAPKRHLVTLHGAARDRLRPEITSQTVVLTTYATLCRDLAFHLAQTYRLALIDEASLIRNPSTDHSRAVAKLNALHRIALTGTPVENSAQDLWSIFRFIQPGWLGTKKHFLDTYETPLKDPSTASQATSLLRLKTLPFILRRTKSQVAPELPSKILIDEYCTLSKDQLTTYRTIRDTALKDLSSSTQGSAKHMATLTTLLRLRQTCCDLALLGPEKFASLPIPRRSAKLERLLEITSQSLAADSRILIFSQFRKQLIEIEKQLALVQVPTLRLDGQSTDRQALVDSFQSANGPPIFLISLKAGGYGLNLTAADVVIHFDPWWNPAAEAQATDRAHRIGQTKPVTVYRLLTRDTVEEKVTQLQTSKRALADSLDETATPSAPSSMSTDELQNLLR